jgi:hypothetical protein
MGTTLTERSLNELELLTDSWREQFSITISHCVVQKIIQFKIGDSGIAYAKTKYMNLYKDSLKRLNLNKEDLDIIMERAKELFWKDLRIAREGKLKSNGASQINPDITFSEGVIILNGFKEIMDNHKIINN